MFSSLLCSCELKMSAFQEEYIVVGRVTQWGFFLSLYLNLVYLQGGGGVAQSCPTLCNPMDHSPPGSSIHGLFQPRVLEWAAISFSRGSSQPQDQTRVSHIVDRHFTVWATREGSLVIMRCLDSTTDSMDMNLSQLWEIVKYKEAWPAAAQRHGLATEQQPVIMTYIWINVF